MQTRALALLLGSLTLGFFIAPQLHAQELKLAPIPRPAPFGLVDTDADGIPDVWETTVFHTDPTKIDTDADNFDDLTEILAGHDPLSKGEYKPVDFDKDGLNDRLELLFGTDPTNPDTDADTFSDGKEIAAGFSPSSSSTAALEKNIVIHLKQQLMEQQLAGITIATYKVSTGKPGKPTPTGTFHVLAKNPRAWSHMAKLWMPWWMEFTTRGHGIHELPEWPGGKKEGAAHLGRAVSHGCVRLGIGPAKAMYDWTPVGTKVVIVR